MALKRKMNSAVKRKKILISFSHPESVLTEQYNNIQANIEFAMNNQNGRTFLITSPNQGEGKTTIAANLAVSMAQQNKKVLLIDANLRNPEIESVFKISTTAGLTNVLTDNVNLDEAIYKTEIGSLDILTGGSVTHNPVELIGSKNMGSLLVNSLNNYDIVLIDSYSVLDIIDTKLLAKICDGVILVIKKGKTKLEEAIEAKSVLEFAKAKLIGTVFNE